MIEDCRYSLIKCMLFFQAFSYDKRKTDAVRQRGETICYIHRSMVPV